MERFYQDLREMFKQHGWAAKHGGKRVSIATYSLREEHVRREFYRLRSGKLVKKGEDGRLVPQPRYSIPTPYALKRKHIEVLLVDWIARDLSTSYIHNLLSMFRTVSTWIGKPNLIPATVDIIDDPKKKRRCQVAMKDKSWSGAGLDISSQIHRIAAEDPHAGLVLELMATFGLRLKEASLLRPWIADQGIYLDVNRGSKGGRDRVHPVTRPVERDLLERAKVLVADRTACLIPRDRSYRQWQDRMYYLLQKHGISRKLVGTSSHGLRHEYLNNLYAQLAGTESPVRGGRSVDCDTDRFARAQLAERAGHTRQNISSCYIGQVVRDGRKEARKGQQSPSVTNPSNTNGSKGEAR
ncbi:MAG: integrase domain-containing protein [Acidiferrobacter sp.]